MIEFNSRESQEEVIKRADIDRFLNTPPTRRELFKLLAELQARVEVLEIDAITPVADKKERLKVNREFIASRSAEIFDGLAARAPLTQIL